MAKKKWYRFYLYLVLEVSQRILFSLPRAVSQRLASVLGTISFYVLTRQRRKTLAHLETVLGQETGSQELTRIASSVFVNLSKTAADVCRFPKLTQSIIDDWVSSDGAIAKLNQVLERGKGAIVLTGHIGNWELLGAYLRLHGYPGKAVGRRIYYDRFNKILVSLRHSAAWPTIYRGEPARIILEELRKNHVLGITPDQDFDSLDGIFVSFFGKPTWTAVSPAKISLASGSAIIPMFMIREGNRYRLFSEDPIWPILDETKEQAIRKMTEMWSGVVERYIRTYPDQWVWMHNRWRTSQVKVQAKPEVLLAEKRN